MATEPRARWSEGDYLLSMVVDNLAYLRYERAGGKGRKPTPVKRPERAPERRRLDVSKNRIDELLFAPRAAT